jgi:hypothetical protein
MSIVSRQGGLPWHGGIATPGFDDWTEAAILARREAMTSWALQRWHVDDDGELSVGNDAE